MKNISIILLFIGTALGGSAFAQSSDLSKTVKGVKDAVITGYKTSGQPVAPDKYLPAYLNGKWAGRDKYELLDEYSLDEVEKITISYDIEKGVHYLPMYDYGVIRVQLIEKNDSSEFVQNGKLSGAVEGLKNAAIAGYKASGQSVAPGKYFPFFINGKLAGLSNHEVLDEYSFDDVKEITISFDKQNGALYGAWAAFGIIQIV